MTHSSDPSSPASQLQSPIMKAHKLLVLQEHRKEPGGEAELYPNCIIILFIQPVGTNLPLYGTKVIKYHVQCNGTIYFVKRYM